MAGPYTLTGTGTQAISPSSALVVTAGTLNAKAQTGGGNPPNLYHVALITPHTSNGWYPARPVTQSPAVLELPAGVDQFGYAVSGANQIVVAEVGMSAINWQKQPWDRNPQPVSAGTNGFISGGNTNAAWWSYTVPSGRIFALAKLRCIISRYTAATTPGNVQVAANLNGTTFVLAVMVANVVGEINEDSIQAGQMWLPAGHLITGTYASTDTGGACHIEAYLAGTLFDA
jgi:hypothetical protein